VTRRRSNAWAAGVGAAVLLAAAGCVSTPPARPDDPGPGAFDRYDPLETSNRYVYRFNAAFDEYVFLPALRGYRFVVPRFVRERISDFVNNLAEVPRFMNSVLQLDPRKSSQTLGRFVINSTWGLGGLFDLAGRSGVPEVNEDFGQTLAFYGVGAGPYLILPILGPSDLRDLGGLLVDRGVQAAIQGLVIGSPMADHPELYAVYLPIVLQYRDDNPFRYGELGPFEYDLVRYLYLEYRQIVSQE